MRLVPGHKRTKILVLEDWANMFKLHPLIHEIILNKYEQIIYKAAMQVDKTELLGIK